MKTCIIKQTKLAAISTTKRLEASTIKPKISNPHSPNHQSKYARLLSVLWYWLLWYGVQDRYAAIKSIGSRAKQESSIPISTGGVGNTELKSSHGIFQIKLPLFNGSEATFNRVCLDQITVKFPQNPLKGIVEEDIAAGYKRQGSSPKRFAAVTTVYWGWHRFHVGNQVLKVLSRKSVTITIWTHNIQILVQECRWH